MRFVVEIKGYYGRSNFIVEWIIVVYMMMYVGISFVWFGWYGINLFYYIVKLK